VLGFGSDINRLWCGGLHIVRQFITGNPRRQIRIANTGCEMRAVEMGGMIQNFKVMAAMSARIKIPASASAKTGLVHFSV